MPKFDEDHVRTIVQDADLTLQEKRDILTDTVGLNEIQADEALQRYGCRVALVGTSLSLPAVELQNPGVEAGEIFLHYLDQLEAETPKAAWNERKTDLIDSINLISQHLKNSHDSKTYGLVVGDIQSGKTSNFLGLAASAMDRKVPLIIILSGSTNTLRNQTQSRFEDVFSVYEDSFLQCLTERDTLRSVTGNSEQWNSGDFDYADPVDLTDGKTRVLIVKKNVHPLGRVLHWLEACLMLSRPTEPILIIDDESDSASINTAPRRENENVAATPINHHIRMIISLMDSDYVGYTATPYAVLLQDPDEDSQEIGKSLYPRNFIVTIPTPAAHCGLAEYFAPHGYLRDRVHIIPDADDHRLTGAHPEMTSSLLWAICDYLITGGIRLLMEGNQFHHTMLVHTDITTNAHHNVAHLIRLQGNRVKNDFLKTSPDGSRTRMFNRLKMRWEDESAYPCLSGVDSENIAVAVSEFCRLFDFRTMVNEINSADADEHQLYDRDTRLDFSKGTPVYSIAVGGTLLSRGLTVEGLTISYFTRNTHMYDSLTQMARWCGYRSRVQQDLTRVNLTEQIHRWFQFMYDVDTRIKEDIMVLQNNPDLGPVDLSPRVLVYRREEDEFYPTRQGAMQTSRITGGTLSGSTQQSLRLKFEELEALNRNVDALSVLLSSVQEIGWKPTQGARGYVAKIDSDRVIEFIQNFELHHSPSMDPDSIVRHIRREQEHYGDLNEWSLAVFSPGQNHESRLDQGVFSTLPTVPNVTQRGVSESGKLEVLRDKTHLFVDILDCIPAGCERTIANARLYRPSSRGLLAVYILDGQYEPDTKGSSHNLRSMFLEANGPDVVAYVIVLPESSHQIHDDEYYIAEGVGAIHDGVDLE